MTMNTSVKTQIYYCSPAQENPDLFPASQLRVWQLRDPRHSITTGVCCKRLPAIATLLSKFTRHLTECHLPYKRRLPKGRKYLPGLMRCMETPHQRQLLHQLQSNINARLPGAPQSTNTDSPAAQLLDLHFCCCYHFPIIFDRNI